MKLQGIANAKTIYLDVHKHSEWIGTLGTTAKLKEGMKISIYDCFHGMMLPSGNDAAMTLCIEFGRWLYLIQNENSGAIEQSFLDPSTGYKKYIQAFMDEMNRQAQSLYCREAYFMNPHGMHAKGHHASAKDINKLMSSAMDYDLVRHVCSDKDCNTKLVDKDYNLVPYYWKNTNQLSNEYFVGSKTGTTPAAGPCLITQFEFKGYVAQGCVINCDNGKLRQKYMAIILLWQFDKFL